MMEEWTPEEREIFLDLVFYGCYYTKDGKRVDPKDVFIEASNGDIITICDFICEYCGKEYSGDCRQAFADGWQHGEDASFCPEHNV